MLLASLRCFDRSLHRLIGTLLHISNRKFGPRSTSFYAALLIAAARSIKLRVWFVYALGSYFRSSLPPLSHLVLSQGQPLLTTTPIPGVPHIALLIDLPNKGEGAGLPHRIFQVP